MSKRNTHRNNGSLEKLWLGFFFGAISIFLSIAFLSPFLA
jgi:hypothetical protein